MLASPLKAWAEPRRGSRAILLIALHADPTTTVGSPENGGVTVYVRELARALAEIGWSVDILTRRAAPAQPACEWLDGARIVRISAGPERPLSNDDIAEYLPEALGAARPLAAARGYAAISSHYWLSGWIADALSDELGVPHAHTMHSLGISREKRDRMTQRRIDVERRLLERARIVTLGVADPALYAEHYGVDPPHLAVIPPGVDTARFAPGQPAQARRALGLRAPGPWIGYVGRLVREKGIEDLLRAFAVLRERACAEPRLFVVGGGSRDPRIRELRALAGDLGVARWTRLLGPLPHEQVAMAFQAADVLAVPSHYEAFGLVAIEARACGTPVLASDVGGLRHVVQRAHGGRRVPARDPAAWADALHLALQPAELSARRDAALRACATARSWRAVAREVVSFAVARESVFTALDA